MTKKFDRNRARIMPGLSTSSKELEERVKARQARPNVSGNVHSTDRAVAEALGKSRLQNARDYVESSIEIENTKQKLSKIQKDNELAIQNKAKLDLQKKDRERQEALDKIINDSKKDSK